jgi:general secretion pathway protein G
MYFQKKGGEKMLKLKRGFTLIELLIVIVIIGILAGIVVGIVGTNAKKKANDTKKKADFHEIQNALEQYFVDNAKYPTAAEFNATDNTNPLVPSLLKDYPSNMSAQSGGKTYTYTVTAQDSDNNPTGYKLTVELENQGDNGANVESAGDPPVKDYYVNSKQ